jgi:hypothetical protein
MDDDIREVEELEDGSSVYEIGPEKREEEHIESFYENLSEILPEQSLKKLSAYLLESIEEDIEARRDWIESVETVKEYLGFSLEDVANIPFPQATRTYDTTLSTALIRFYATTRAELLPQSGPAGVKINGNDNEEMEAKGAKVRDWLNHYLTVVDEAYYSDFERFLLYLGLYGSGFKKVYYDNLLQRPLSRFIIPQDFIIDSDCTSILESNRLTHVLHLSKREIILNQENNIYRNVELSYLKTGDTTGVDNYDLETSETTKQDEVNLDAYTRRSLFPIYEVHTYLNLEDFLDDGMAHDTENTVPLPYIVVIDKITKEILSIKRNWEESDPEMNRINYFVQYNYLPGFGVYGIGLAHLIGSNAISLTKLLRQLIDAGTFKNLPGGLRAKGFKQQQNDLIVGPGQFVEVDTGGIPLGEAFMPLPYSEPSQVLRELRMELIQQTKELSSTSEMGMLDSKEDIATGTAVAFMEVNNRIQSAVLRSIHYSLSRELQLIEQTFKKTLEYEQFAAGGETHEITNDDFDDEIKIIPIADPASNSTVQRIMKAESVLHTASQDPQIHNMRNIFKMVYKAQGMDEQEIESILIPDPNEEEVLSLDPISENINSLLGKPIKAAIWQDHAAHKLTHGIFANDNPELKPVLAAHIKEHEAYEYLIKMQQMLGIEMPPLEEIQNPEVQNRIAMATANALNEQMEQNSMNGVGPAQQQPIDPNAVMMADIQQQAAETEAKERIANLKAETDIFKAQLDFEKEKAKIQSDKEIANLKTEADVFKTQLNFEGEKAKLESNEDIAELKSETEITKQEIAANEKREQQIEII